jgi:MinD-like ATPase involved in chromosome partitioning or flagellar assembly
MNRASANVGLKTREVEDGLKVKVGQELPMDRSVQLCVNRGEPAVLAEPRSEFSRGLAALAKQVAPKAEASKHAKSSKKMLSFARA